MERREGEGEEERRLARACLPIPSFFSACRPLLLLFYRITSYVTSGVRVRRERGELVD